MNPKPVPDVRPRRFTRPRRRLWTAEEILRRLEGADLIADDEVRARARDPVRSPLQPDMAFGDRLVGQLVVAHAIGLQQDVVALQLGLALGHQAGAARAADLKRADLGRARREPRPEYSRCWHYARSRAKRGRRCTGGVTRP